MHIFFDNKVYLLILSQIIIGPTTYQWCKAHFTDYVGQDSLQEPVNPGRIARAPRDNWEEEFERYAARLLDQVSLE